ncbi:hematopoietic SH2 domain-containing protein homolog isoform X2 [Scyliorhinus canicula]|uniref:hematopoietic SH2 domain-containing protein homolog isoform X2 n=1 Tax=Scyliorhinus canicula TaxID=7830 RepID=UPI0018F5A211|nr:hematopoietic SH2 domain-containing protein homolog isoform X2 [Scyliorhinus canicula]XP_038634031.1 hematopoietic SH2 domain-containing protein homolog isoform X2 [Scyliorhinus canicula]
MDVSNVALTRKAAITWFHTTQSSKIVRDGVVPDWFHGIISRRGLDRCRHFILDITTGGQYNIAGEGNFHNSLQDLVTFHRHIPIVPFNECLSTPCGQASQSGAQNLLLQRTQLTNLEMKIHNPSSRPDVSVSKSEVKHQADDNVPHRHPILTQRQHTKHMTAINSFVPATSYTDNPPTTGSQCVLPFPAHHIPHLPPRTTRGQFMSQGQSMSQGQPVSHGQSVSQGHFVSQGQSVSHRPTSCSRQFDLVEPVGGYQLLSDCTEGERRNQASDIDDLPVEYMTPPPYAPGY